MAGRHRKHKNNQLTSGKYALAGAIASIGIAAITANTGSASAATDDEWNSVAKCESSNNWTINTGNGFYGGLQFKQSTWRSFGGTQYAQRADLASRSQQIAIAEKVLHTQGKRAWPVCGHSLSTVPYTGLPTHGYSTALPGPEMQSGQYATGFTGLIQTADKAINQAINGLIQNHAAALRSKAVTRQQSKIAIKAPHKALETLHQQTNAVRIPHNSIAARHILTQNKVTRTLDAHIVQIRQDPPPLPQPTYPPLNQVPPPGGYPHSRQAPHPHPGRRFNSHNLHDPRHLHDPHQQHFNHHDPHQRFHAIPPRGPHQRNPLPPREINDHAGKPVPAPHRYVPTPGLHQVPAPNPAHSIFSLQGQTPNINPNALGDVLNALGAANAHIDPQKLFSNPGQFIPNVGQMLGNNNTNNPAAKGAQGIAQFVSTITNMLGTGPTQSITNGAPIVPGIGPRN